jgi:Na+(H+)/acetate symporter ActP
MKTLPIIDLAVICLYLVAMVYVGYFFSRKNKNAGQFTTASGRIPGWAIGLSIYATFLSSNTFLGVPGKAFGTNWNAFAFSISMPLAAWVAAKYFVPFYRSTGEVSAYTNLEKRFGPWARTYAVVCFLLTQIARMGSIFFWTITDIAGTYRLQYADDHADHGDMYHPVHGNGWHRSGDMDRSGAGNSENTRSYIDRLPGHFTY